MPAPPRRQKNRKDALNRQFQRAIQTNDSSSLRRLTGAGVLSSKQRKLAGEHIRDVTVASRQKLQTAHASRALMPGARDIRALIDSEVARLGLVKDYRADPNYSALYRQAGCPSTWPHPLPVYVGQEGVYRYAFSQFHTQKMVFTLPPGEATLILPRFWEDDYSLVALASADSTLNQAWDRRTYMLDRAVLSYRSTAGSTIEHPNDMLEDQSSIKTAGPRKYWAKPDVTQGQPLLSQLIGGSIRAEIACTYDGQYTTAVLCEGDNPTHLGPKTEQHTYDVAQDQPYTTGIPPGMTGKYRTIYGAVAATSAAQVCDQFGTLSMHTGATAGANVHFEVPLARETGWQFNGVMDATDAPASGVISVQNNMRPRDNVQYMMQYGCVQVRNTGSVAITVIAHANYVQAHLLHQDDEVRQVPALASSLHQQCDALKINAAAAPSVSSPTTSRGRTPQEVATQMAKKLLARGTHPGAAASASRESLQPNKTPKITPSGGSGSKAKVAERIVQGGLAAYGGQSLISKMVGAGSKAAPGAMIEAPAGYTASAAASAAAGGGSGGFWSGVGGVAEELEMEAPEIAEGLLMIL